MDNEFTLLQSDGTEVFNTPTAPSLERLTAQIRNNLSNIITGFVKIGFVLNVIKQEELYKKGKEKSFNSIYDYAKETFGLSKTNVKNFTNIVVTFAKRNEKGVILPELKEEYKEYSASQLVELLSLTELEREEITPDMTISEIRDKKKESKDELTKAEQLQKEKRKNYTAILKNDSEFKKLDTYYKVGNSAVRQFVGTYVKYLDQNDLYDKKRAGQMFLYANTNKDFNPSWFFACAMDSPEVQDALYTKMLQLLDQATPHYNND